MTDREKTKKQLTTQIERLRKAEGERERFLRPGKRTTFILRLPIKQGGQQ